MRWNETRRLGRNRKLPRWAALATALLLGAACSDEAQPPPAPAGAGPAPAAAPAPPRGPEPADPAAGAGDRTAPMQARLAELQALQETVRERFNDLAYRAGRTDLGAERAREAARLFDRAGYRIRMPKGPGAFSDVAGVEREIEALHDVQAVLDRIEALVEDGARR